MELFKLLGTIAIDNKNANKALDETSGKGEKSESKLSKAFSGIGKGAAVVGKAVATGMVAAGAAVAGLVGASVKAYADYEQLVGGVDTLFKNSSAKVQEYAKNAYKTAGLSANGYMETVTSFSASLLQSLDGDTKKAADAADQAIVDMSDNANKMGTDMSMIQNAYQGFAKQNYTMLDNLKLGYGGTKTEMQRLLDDAAKISGIQYDISSFADITEAIHVVQTEMGITGTTAKEAATTISGSLSSMKGAWQNVLTAISSDELPFDDYVSAFVDSVSTVASNLMPRIKIALNGVVSLIDKLAPVIIAEIPSLFSDLLPSIIKGAIGLVNSIVSILPSLVNTLVSDLLPQLLSGIVDIVGALISALPSVIESICSALPTLLPMLISGIVSIIVMLCQNFSAIIQPIIDNLPAIIVSIVDALLDNLPALLGGILQLIIGVARAIPSLIGAIWEAIKGVIGSLGSHLGEWLSPVWEAITGWFSNLWTSISGWFSSAWEKISGFFQSLWQGVSNVFTKIGEVIWTAIRFIGSIFKAAFDIITLPFRFIWENCKEYVFAAWNWIKEKVTAAINAVKNVINKVWTGIKNFLSPILNGIKNTFSTVWNAIKNAVSTAVNAVKNVITKIWTSIKTATTNAWNAVKNAISKPINAAKTTVSNIFNNIKSKISTVVNSIKTTVSNVFNKVKEAMSKPIEKARDTIKGIVDKIKGFFSGMKIKFPKLKMPHFSVSPDGWKIGDLLKGKIPKLSIKWYAEAMRNPMIMTKPTVFGYDAGTGQLMGGGEAGSEVVSGTNTLMNMITAAVGAQNETVAYYLQKLVEMLADYFPEILDGMNNPRPAVFDTNRAAAALAIPMNRELGRLTAQKGRGR